MNLLGNLPEIPGVIMRDMYRIDTCGGEYDRENGGHFSRGRERKVRFKGALLPLSEKDLRRLPQGTVTANQKKIYTNGFSLNVGSMVQASDGLRYTVIRELEYDGIHGMRRYVVERKGGAQAK